MRPYAQQSMSSTILSRRISSFERSRAMRGIKSYAVTVERIAISSFEYRWPVGNVEEDAPGIEVTVDPLPCRGTEMKYLVGRHPRRDDCTFLAWNHARPCPSGITLRFDGIFRPWTNGASSLCHWLGASPKQLDFACEEHSFLLVQAQWVLPMSRTLQTRSAAWPRVGMRFETGRPHWRSALPLCQVRS